jgi:MFS family permease
MPPHTKSNLARQNLSHNYLAFAVEGGLFSGAFAFVQPQMLMPKVIQTLHGPTWLISLMPVMLSIGYGLPPLFVAHQIERLDHYRPLLLVTGFFQRLPYLIAGLLLLWGQGRFPFLTLLAVSITPLLNGLVGGIGGVAWQQLFMRIIPENKRASLFGWRLTLSCVLGVLGGLVVKYVLQAWPGVTGYGILHLMAFVILIGSLAVFYTIIEPQTAPKHRVGLSFYENLRRLPRIVPGQTDFLWTVVSRFFRSGMMIGMPFVGLYALKKLGKSEDFLGELIVAQMIGSVCGNFLAGYWGDKSGARPATLTAILCFLPVTLAIPMASTPLHFFALFVLFGFSFSATDVGFQALILEVCPQKDMATFLSLGAILNVPSMVLAGLLGAFLWTRSGSMVDLMLATGICVVISALLLVNVREKQIHHFEREWDKVDF